MRTLSKRIAFFLLLSTLTGSAQDALETLVANEKTFAQQSLTVGIRQSFLQFLAPDSIVLKPEPANGKQLYGKADDTGRKLFWQPVFAAIAGSGDLGVTSGPWEMRTADSGDKPVAFGQFVSVWKKERDGSWKVVLDAGTQNPQPTEMPAEASLLRPNQSIVTVDPARRTFSSTENEFAQMLKEGAGAAIATSAADDIRVLRDDVFPATGKIAARLMLSSDNGKMVRKTLGGSAATSTDFAYRYGSYNCERGNMIERGYFVTVWQAANDQEWKIILDLQNKTPEKKP